MLNTAFIQSNLPNLQTQEQLLKDRLEVEKANGYNFELVETKKEKYTVKFANKIELEDREYSLEELNDLFLALLDGLVEGIIREADTRNLKAAKLCYGIESILIPWGIEIRDSRGFVLFYPPYKRFNYYTEEEEFNTPYLIGMMLVNFNSSETRSENK